MASKYLIPEPTDTNWMETGYTGRTLYVDTSYGDRYHGAVVEGSVDAPWWAIGMIANVSGVARPIVISNTEKYATILCNKYPGRTGERASLVYKEKTYYYTTENMYATSFDMTYMKDNAVPFYSEQFSDYKSAALKLIELYKAEGGLMPGEEPEPSREYSKVEYTRINWENKSTSLKTPLNESNLNKMDKAISDLCENLDIAHTESDVKKLDKSSANKLISETPTWDAETGILIFKFFDGTQFSVDFNIEKIPVSFSMDSAGVITMETADGTKWTADISKAIPSAYTFSNGARITFTETTGEDGTKKITADLVKGSITDEYLATDFLAKITSNVNAASSSAASAASSATDAAADAKLAQSYAIGGSGIRDGEDTDNAKYYAQKSAENLEYAKNLVTSGDDITE